MDNQQDTADANAAANATIDGIIGNLARQLAAASAQLALRDCRIAALEAENAALKKAS